MMELKKPLNVFFVVDKKFIVHFTVTLTSLLENNKDLAISVYVVHDFQDIKIFENVLSFFKEKYGVILNLAELNNSVFDNLPITENISKASYFRLLLSDIIPADVQSGLYIDCDTIVTASLKKLTDIDYFDKDKNDEYSLLAVPDPNGSKDGQRLSKLGVHSKFYFNAGVLMINLKKWRSDDVSGKLIAIAEKYKEHLTWHDQDVLNIFFVNKCGELSSAYNKTASHEQPEVPIIIHYTGSSKPWHYLNNSPYRSFYWKYLKMTLFRTERFEQITLQKRVKKYKRIAKRILKIEK